MTDPNLFYSPGLLSKSSPSQLHAFQFKESRTPPFPAETLLLEKPSKSSNLSHVPCKFFKQGSCTAGANCTFSHSLDISSESSVCRYFIKGNCKFGTKCALLHTMSPYSSVDRKIQLNERSGSAFSFTTLEDAWNPFDWNTSCSFDNNQLSLYDDDEINDAMLPSSLNDLFTPSELHSRRVRQEGYTSEIGSTWRVPFITKSDYDARGLEDEDVQFIMDEVEGTHNSMEDTLSTLFQNKMKMNQNNNNNNNNSLLY